jgi:hypothetical protein
MKQFGPTIGCRRRGVTTLGSPGLLESAELVSRLVTGDWTRSDEIVSSAGWSEGGQDGYDLGRQILELRINNHWFISCKSSWVTPLDLPATRGVQAEGDDYQG